MKMELALKNSVENAGDYDTAQAVRAEDKKLLHRLETARNGDYER